MNNYENELINNKKQQLSKEFYAKMEEMKQNINLFANTNLNEDTSKDAIAYLVVENAKLIKENQQLKKQKDDVVEYIRENKNKTIAPYGDNEDIDYEVCLFEEDINELLRMLGEIK